MKIIKPNFEILDKLNGEEILKKIEQAGRVCYKSECKIQVGSARKFVESIIKKGHESVLEHEKVSVRIICDRGVSHEIVRCRIASYSQESTRYCNYSDDRFDKEISVVEPLFFEPGSKAWMYWVKACQMSENMYFSLLDEGCSPQQARSVLPNSVKRELVMTMNLREWRHFFRIRTSKAAHAQMREITIPLLQTMKEKIPVIFDDITTGLEELS